MTEYKSCAHIRNQAKELLTGKYTAVTLTILTYFMLTIVVDWLFSSMSTMLIQMIMRLLGLNTVLVAHILLYLLSIITATVLGVFKVGLSFYFLNLICGGTYHSSNLSYGFHNTPQKALTLSLVFALISAVCMAPFQFLAFILQYGGEISWFLLLAAYLVGYLAYIVLTLCISQVYLLTLDFPSLSVKELLKRSCQIMKGHKLRFFKLQLSFIPLLILGIFSLGIGLIWVMPYSYTSAALFFLDLMKPKENN